MDVLSIERGYESPIDAVDDVVGEVVGFVLQLFDPRDFGSKLGGSLKKLLKKTRRGR